MAKKTSSSRKAKANVEKLMAEGKPVTENIVECSDGTYRWVYDISLFKNPYILKLVLKVFVGIAIGLWFFHVVLTIVDGDFNIIDALITFGCFVGFATAMTLIGYFFYAAVMGFHYSVLFEMDETAITQQQVRRQTERLHGMAALAGFLAFFSNSHATTHGLLLNASSNRTSRPWKIISSIEVNREKDLIKIFERTFPERIYAKPADFDFVLEYVKQHIPTNRIS